MIKFQCKKCGKRFAVPQTHAGKKGKCPKCKSIVVVPKSATAGQTDSGYPQAGSKKSPYDLSLLDVPQEDKARHQPPGKYEVSGEDFEELQATHVQSTTKDFESTNERKRSWPIDIFLYPTSKPGLTNLAIFIGPRLTIDVLDGLLGESAAILTFPSLVIDILIGLYMIWYFAECVRDSAAGGIRAPEAFATADLSEMLSQALHISACYILFIGPVGFYRLYIQKTDMIFWLLLTYAIVFSPMGLLAMVMFNSATALNPILLMGSIFSTFLQYCGLVLILAVVVLPTVAVSGMRPDTQVARILGFIVYPVQIYLALVIAHLLGRFYWRHQDRLNWEA
jgi:phage FluMu protein Com